MHKSFKLIFLSAEPFVVSSKSYSPPPASSYSSSVTSGPPEHRLKVLNLNAWGLSWPWSRDRKARFKALREIIALSDYDVILLQVR